MLSSSFFIGFSLIFFGYIFQSSVLYYFFYVLRASEREHWKTQTEQGKDQEGLFFFWPLLERKSKSNHPKNYRTFTSINLFIASCVAGLVSDGYSQGWNLIRMRADDEVWNLRFSSLPDSMLNMSPIHFFGMNVNWIITTAFPSSSTSPTMLYFSMLCLSACCVFIEFLFLMALQLILEYYWHILMHLPWFYRNLHKFHHHFRSPEVWNDLYIHPAEAFGYYCILHSPTLTPCHLSSYLLYMIICGLCGVIDHSGISSIGTEGWRTWLKQKELQNKIRNEQVSSVLLSSLSFPWRLLYGVLYQCSRLYCSSDHDRHHSQWAVNFGFPIPVIDLLHGTYEGEYLGHTYHANRRRWGKIL